MDSGQLIGVLVVAGILTLLAVWFTRGWLTRRRAQAGLPELATPPATLGAATYTDDLFYVATTRADAPTDRIAVRGLAFRARAGIAVHSEGAVLSIAGQPDAFIPKSAVIGVGRATWTIDRVVGKEGLVFLRWILGDIDVDTNLRSADPDALLAALATIGPARTAPTERGAA